jgi:hypothetical protein
MERLRRTNAPPEHHRSRGFPEFEVCVVGADAISSVPGRNVLGQPDKPSVFHELWMFMKHRKKFWLGPIVLVLLLLGALIVFTEGSALAPLIYTLF